MSNLFNESGLSDIFANQFSCVDNFIETEESKTFADAAMNTSTSDKSSQNADQKDSSCSNKNIASPTPKRIPVHITKDTFSTVSNESFERHMPSQNKEFYNNTEDSSYRTSYKNVTTTNDIVNQGYSIKSRHNITRTFHNSDANIKTLPNSDERNKQAIPVIMRSNINKIPMKHTALFEGYANKRNHIDRFFISGISTSSSESGMRSFLEDNGIRFTFLRYFAKPNAATHSAQLNVVATDSQYISDRSFWPVGIRVRRWIPSSKFYTEREYDNTAHK